MTDRSDEMKPDFDGPDYWFLPNLRSEFGRLYASRFVDIAGVRIRLVPVCLILWGLAITISIFNIRSPASILVIVISVIVPLMLPVCWHGGITFCSLVNINHKLGFWQVISIGILVITFVYTVLYPIVRDMPEWECWSPKRASMPAEYQ